MLSRVWGNTKIDDSLVPTLASKNTEPRKPHPSSVCSFLASHLQQKTETNVMSGVAFRWELGHAEAAQTSSGHQLGQLNILLFSKFAAFETREPNFSSHSFGNHIISGSSEVASLKERENRSRDVPLQSQQSFPSRLPYGKRVLSGRPGTHRTQMVARRAL